jgi:flagellar biosynthesis regulator FlaF
LHNEFVVNILQGAISGKKAREKTSTTILTASRQKHSYTAVIRQLYGNEKKWLATIPDGKLPTNKKIEG